MSNPIVQVTIVNPSGKSGYRELLSELRAIRCELVEVKRLLLLSDSDRIKFAGTAAKLDKSSNDLATLVSTTPAP